jgi:hypothetical protein
MRKRGKKRRTLVGTNPLYILESHEKLSTSDRLKIKTFYHSAMAAIATGGGDPQAWDCIAGTILIGSWLSQPGKLYPEADPTFNMAWKCLLNAGWRYNQGNTMGFTGLERKIINTALLIHDEQLNHATIGNVESAREYATSLVGKLSYAVVVPKLKQLSEVSDLDIYVLGD